MSTQAFHDFRTRLAEDEFLQEEMQAALGTSVLLDVPPEALVPFAEAHGFHFTVDDVPGERADSSAGRG